MNRLLQISDTHFGTERPDVVRSLVELVRQRAPRLVVLSGDITQRARRVEFAAARRFVDALDAPARIVIPGNHDISLFNLAARVFTPYARFRRAFGDALEPIYRDGDLLVIALNTTRPWRHKNGAVSAPQIDAVGQLLARAAPGQLRVVVTHQPVAVTRDEDCVNLLRGGDRAVRAWASGGADLILGGHIHLPYCLPLHERERLDRPLWAVQAGTAVSHRLRPGTDNSINEIEWNTAGARRSARLTRWDWTGASEAFRVVAQADLLLGS